MKRVAMFVATDVATDSRVVKTARSLAAGGYDVTVVHTGPEWQPADGAFRARTTTVDRSRPKPRRWRRVRPDDDPLRIRPYREAWLPLLEQLAPDAVHAHDVHALALVPSAVPLIYDAHELQLGKTFKTPERAAAYREAFIELARGAQAIVTVSDALAERLRDDLALDAQPIVLYNTPSLVAEPAPPLRELTGAGDAPLAVYGGALTRHRRLDTLAAALALVPQLHLALVVSADDAALPPLLADVEAAGARDRVHVTGYVPPASVVSLLAGADVGVHPLARYPNGDVALPNKLFEYLHAGIRAVVSDAPEMARFVAENGTGEAVALDAEQWAAALERALAAPRLDRAAGFDELRRRWSWEAQEPKLLDLYAGLAP